MGAVAGVVFDIDDTLCLESCYIRSGFRAVANHLDCPDAFDILWRSFLEGVRGTNFDCLLDERIDLAQHTTVADLVQVYRNHAPEIALSSDREELIDELTTMGVKLGAISDGPVETQERKAQALGLYDRLDPIILTGRWGREFSKPHPQAYEAVEEVWRLAPDELVYVGDNPAKDFVTANERGWHTVRLRSPGQLHENATAPSREHAAEHEVASVLELTSMLLSLLESEASG